MSTDFQGIEGGEAPSQAGTDDMSASEMSDEPTACHLSVHVEQQTDAQVNTGRTAVEPVQRDHDDAKRRRGGRAKLDVRLGEDTLDALRVRAKRHGVAPSTYVRNLIRDKLDKRRTEEFDALIAGHQLSLEKQVQASADARELASLIRPLAINVNDLDRRARKGEQVDVSGAMPELVELLREVRTLLGDRVSS